MRNIHCRRHLSELNIGFNEIGVTILKSVLLKQIVHLYDCINIVEEISHKYQLFELYKDSIHPWFKS